MRILCVDDEPAFLEVFCTKLEALGHQTFKASNGRKGVSMIHQTAPDIVFADIRMPVMDGIAMFHLASQAAAHPPFIFLTGLADCLPLHQKGIIKKYGIPVLSKLHTPQELDKAIETALSTTNQRECPPCCPEAR